MVGSYGQILPARGWTATAFESIGDDDPEDHTIRVDLEVLAEDSLDPDLMDHDVFSIQPWIRGDERVYVADGRHMFVRREDLYG